MRSDLNQNTTLPCLVDQASWMLDVFNMGYKQIWLDEMWAVYQAGWWPFSIWWLISGSMSDKHEW